MSGRSWSRATLAAAALALGWTVASASRPGARGGVSPLRVLTYNIHHGEGLDGRFDLPRVADILNRADADLIALQEVDQGTRRAGGVDQLTELGRLTGRHAVFGKAMDFEGGAYGVGVLSRVPVRRTSNRRLPGSPDREPRTALTVDVDLPEHGPRVLFTSTHLDQGRDAMDKVAQASFLAGTLAPDADDVGILAGDLNTRADQPALLILARRWTDTFVDPPPLPDGRQRRRVDYVLVRPAGSWRIVESRFLDAPLVSDHQPVLVVLEWIGSGRTR